LIYLLDTNTVIARLNGNPAVSERLAALEPDEVVLCAPVLAELLSLHCSTMSPRRLPTAAKSSSRSFWPTLNLSSVAVRCLTAASERRGSARMNVLRGERKAGIGA
jgi:hypothetical protein